MAYTQANVDAALNAANAGTTHVQLHTADPGAAGTTAVAANASAREAITLPAASAGASSNAVTFTITAGGETYTHISLWSDLTAGTHQGNGVLTPQESFAGPGTLDVTVNTSASST